MIDAKELTDVASDKALKSRKPKALEPGRYTVILEPRANARFLSLMTGIFNARTAEGCGRRLLRRQAGREQEAGRQDLQRSVHAEERHRQSDPAADADRSATTGRRRR